MFSCQLCPIELDPVDWKLTQKSDLAPPKSIEFHLLAGEILVIRLINLKWAEIDLPGRRRSQTRLPILGTLLREFLHVKEANKNFNNLTVNKVRERQWIISLEKGKTTIWKEEKERVKRGSDKVNFWKPTHFRGCKPSTAGERGKGLTKSLGAVPSFRDQHSNLIFCCSQGPAPHKVVFTPS